MGLAGVAHPRRMRRSLTSLSRPTETSNKVRAFHFIFDTLCYDMQEMFHLPIPLSAGIGALFQFSFDFSIYRQVFLIADGMLKAMKKTIWKSILCAMLVTLTACILCIGAFAAKYTCIKSGCNREAAKGSAYCWVHKPTKSNSGVSGSGSRPSGSSSSTKHKYTCIKDGCTREADKDSAYCWVHRPSKSSTKSSTSYSSKSSYSSSYSSSKKSYKAYDSYDDGYDAIYDDDDYDEDRYDSDPDYAAGVDDAMDELDCYIN